MVDGVTVYTGQEAIERMTETWQEAFHGKVHIDVIDPWLKVSREGADYACYISLVDDTVVTVDPAWADRDTDEDVPNDLYPDELVADETREMLSKAFSGPQTGAYPMPDADQFWKGFRDDDGQYKRLVVGLRDDTVTIEDDT